MAGGLAPHGRRAPHVLAWTAVAITVLLIGGILTAYTAYREIFGKIRQVTVTGLGRRPPGYDNSLNVLVIGSDTRKGRNSRFGAHVGGQRSDTVLVLHLSPGYRRAVVLSVPRDSVVPVLTCPPESGSPGQTAQPGQVEQINATFAYGGPSCLWKTIEQTTHIRLDHFIELNFAGFERVINDLGGVNICLPFPINDPHSKLHLSSGMHHVMGARALAYWRVRYIGMGSDLERIMRDQYLMASVAQGVRHANLLGDPVRLFKIMSDVASSLTTDSQLSQGMLLSLAQGLKNMPLSEVHFIQVPVSYYPANKNWVQWSPQAAALFSAIAHDRHLPKLSKPARRPGSSQLPAGNGIAAGRGGRSAQAKAPAPAGQASRPGGVSPSTLSNLARNYGGITAGANVCRDAGAFSGPLGGH